MPTVDLKDYVLWTFRGSAVTGEIQDDTQLVLQKDIQRKGERERENEPCKFRGKKISL